jgi:hypothetical protein
LVSQSLSSAFIPSPDGLSVLGGSAALWNGGTDLALARSAVGGMENRFSFPNSKAPRSSAGECERGAFKSIIDAPRACEAVYPYAMCHATVGLLGYELVG